MMHIYRRASMISGSLLLSGTILGIFSISFLRPLSAPQDLGLIAAGSTSLTIGALLVVAMGIACAGISLSLYPVLRRHSESLAAGAVVFRSLEGVFDILGAVAILGILFLSEKGGYRSGEVIKIQAEMLVEFRVLLRDVAMFICWNVGAMCYYILFFRARLLPRWLSLWGIMGIVLAFLSCLFFLFHLYPPFSTAHVLLNLPIALQEMVLALWLIIKGFDNVPSI